MENLHFEVLRLFDGQNNNEDWHPINSSYTSQDIEKIKDPASGTMKEITSIPSPFARIHLFEHAFKAVTEEGKANPAALNGNTMFHKLVSDSLDVGEVLFNYDVLDANPAYKLDVLTWNKDEHLRALQDSHSERHRLLGETLRLFLKQDREGSKFDSINNIHLVECNYMIIGGTSPSTLFFAGYNDNFTLSQLNLKQGNDTFFDLDYRPLHFRSVAYQRYLHGLFKVFPELQQQMTIFYDYLRGSLNYLRTSGDSIYRDLMQMLQDNQYGRTQFFSEFEELTIGRAGNVLDIIPGIYLRKSTNESALASGEESDFAIKADFTDIRVEGKVPLVLVNGFKKIFKYFGGDWDPSYRVPHAPSEPVHERILPGQMVKYPYLTTSDFLEPYLIQLEYRLDKDHFFNGNPDGFSAGDKASSSPPDSSYLLPLKPLFFEYFRTEKLKEKTSDGKQIFRMRKIGADSVVVELRIPIHKAGEYVTFERIYRINERPDEGKNEGAIVEFRMNLGFLPMIKGNGPFFQYVGLVDNDILDDTMSNEYRLYFYQCGDRLPIPPVKDTVKSDKRRHNRNATTRYYIVEKPYDVVMVDTGNARGIVMPIFKTVGIGDKQFTFAIDFGTTNTHIEYSVDGGRPLPFEIGKEELQFITLIERDSEWYFSGLVKDMFFHEFIPDLIGKNQTYSFPIRTVTTEIENLNHNTGPIPIGDINISFVFEKWQILKNSRIETNLKWQNFDPRVGAHSINRLRALLSELLILIRNKVIINGGDLNRTRLVWFYPSSMDSFQVQAFSSIWLELAKRYISDQSEPLCYSEAVAPFYMHSDQKVHARQYPVVSIDIGGGTTDIAIFEKDQPRFVTSAKFAGNVVWGDGFSEQPDEHNGIVRVFKPVVKQFLDSNVNNGLYNLAKTFEQIEADPRFTSSDLMSFFFSIDRNRDVLSKQLDFNFSRKVAENQDFKIVFLVFFSSIIYYLARMMKIANVEKPRYITLSGNGSRIVNLLDTHARFQHATLLTRFIFERVYGSPYFEDGLEIIQHSDPKESTCKGGIRRLSKGEVHEYDAIIWVGDEPSEDLLWSIESHKSKEGFNEKLGTVINAKKNKINSPGNQIKYNAIDDNLKKSVIEEYKHFLDLVKEGHYEINYANLFGVRSNRMEQYLAILKRDALSHLSAGLSKRLQITAESENIAESLFFYPLIGGLYQLINEIGDELAG